MLNGGKGDRSKLLGVKPKASAGGEGRGQSEGRDQEPGLRNGEGRGEGGEGGQTWEEKREEPEWAAGRTQSWLMDRERTRCWSGKLQRQTRARGEGEGKRSEAGCGAVGEQLLPGQQLSG